MAADSEYFIQLFLFGATVFCYILLFVFVTYGIYHCCFRTCMKVRRRRHKERKEAEKGGDEDVESVLNYPGQVTLISPFQKNVKATIVSGSNQNPMSQAQAEDAANQNVQNGDVDQSQQQQNYFTDKKYYEIFVA